MAKIASSFKCLICKNPLNFPNDISIIEFIVMLLQFYQTHEVCEQKLLKNPPITQADIKAVKKRRKRSVVPDK